MDNVIKFKPKVAVNDKANQLGINYSKLLNKLTVLLDSEDIVLNSMALMPLTALVDCSAVNALAIKLLMVEINKAIVAAKDYRVDDESIVEFLEVIGREYLSLTGDDWVMNIPIVSLKGSFTVIVHCVRGKIALGGCYKENRPALVDYIEEAMGYTYASIPVLDIVIPMEGRVLVVPEGVEGYEVEETNNLSAGISEVLNRPVQFTMMVCVGDKVKNIYQRVNPTSREFYVLKGSVSEEG